MRGRIKMKTINMVNKIACNRKLYFYKHKYINKEYFKNLVWSLFRFLLLIGLCFIIISPFITKLSSSLMGKNDLYDLSVQLIPREPTLDNIKILIDEVDYYKSLFNTTFISLICAILQMLSCTIIGYGLGNFKFKGRGIVFAMVIITIFIPPHTILISLFMKFRFFDILNIFKTVIGENINMIDTLWPMVILSATGLGFKNGLYILIMRQFFTNVPKELEEAAEVDGAGLLKIFLKIKLPLAKNMMLTIFLFAFSWQFTDDFYSGIFFNKVTMLSKIIFKAPYILLGTYADKLMIEVFTNTAALLVVIPLLIFFVFAQRKLIEGMENAGIKG